MRANHAAALERHNKIAQAREEIQIVLELNSEIFTKRLQRHYSSLGRYKGEIDGVVTDELRQIVEGCLIAPDCAVAMDPE